MTEKDAGLLPEEMSEIDFLKFENLQLKVAIARQNLDTVSKDFDDVQKSFAEKYQLSPKDAVDTKTRRIVRNS